jgi:murein DD-endopeptidase MepM/ murein hydrolase activator NlpD
VRPNRPAARGGRPRAPWLLAAALVTSGVLLPVSASAQSIDELDREREQVEQRRSELSSDLEDKRGHLADAEEELAAIGARLEDARGRLRAAEGQLALAEAAEAEAEAARVAAVEEQQRKEAELAETEAELARQEGILGEQAVATYKFGSVGARAGSAAFDVMRRASDPNELAVGMHHLGAVVAAQGTTVEAVTELRDEHARLAREASEARQAAAEAAAEATQQVRFTEELRAEADALATEVAEQEAEQQAVTEQLRTETAETEEALERVAARQSELESEIAEKRAAEERERQAAAEREARAARAARGGGAGGGPSHGGVCPVVGAVAGRDFSNDWGYPRSGGRTHQGNDIFARRGTPIVAIQDGTVVRVNATESGLGGLTVTYRTGDGSEWYNAHLETIASGMSPGVEVSQGQTIGTVGDTGNARGTPPHNHIGRRHGGQWVNPWPTISPLCR